MAVTESIALLTVLGKGFIEVMKTKPNYNQAKIAEYEEKFNAFITETTIEGGDTRLIGELHDWLLSHGKNQDSYFKA